MESQRTSFGFPFRVDDAGRIASSVGDEAIHGKIIQVLLTTPGERVNLPDFGCGLFNLVFEPNDTVLAAAVEFTIGQALTRWLNDEIVVDNVDVQSGGEKVVIEVVYTKRSDLSRQALRVHLP
jgi:phage baseplate assembly protein W